MGVCPRRWACGMLVLGALAGCSATPERPPGTGAKEAVQTYYETLLHKDWRKAYSVLDPSSRSRLSADQFARLAQNYVSRLGFEPEAVHVWACDERDAEATAHVILRGRNAKQERRYKDAITLQRSDDGWHVVLPSNFGRDTKR
jgi:hypothetical protein